MSNACCECHGKVLGKQLTLKYYRHPNEYEDIYIECPDCGTENVIILGPPEETVIGVLTHDNDDNN